MGRRTKLIEKQIAERLGEERLNNQGYLMKIVKYENWSNIVVEFLDKYRGRVHTSYQMFQLGAVRNPYQPNVLGVGMVGVKYSTKINGKHNKEYIAWHGIIERCYDNKYKEKHPTYKDVTVCDEWLLFENFYEWLHEQENFDKWYNGYQWNVDKDILIKGNKLYSPETCCLVPNNVNKLFIKTDALRGNLPIGVSKDRNNFKALCNNPFIKECKYLGEYKTPEEAFYFGYKPYKENLIKQVAQIEYDNGNITEKCYNAMMNYEVEITD